MINYLTIDVEDYFQVSAFDGLIRIEDWDSCELRVERNTHNILKILAEKGIRATFFIVGWVAERLPALIREIDKAGHEIGCHSYLHRRIYTLTPDQFQQDTRKAKDILENIIGKKVRGYRAPSYSITKQSLWALDILEKLGFEYDSSIFPIRHDFYGIPDSPRFPYKLVDHELLEYPISTAVFGGVKLPVAGGGYFRLFPYWFTKMALQRINEQEEKPFMFYLHPWEIDPGQPRMQKASRLSRFRHYNNLDKTEERLHRLLGDFAFGPITGCT
ncbi:MAG: polysaccharide deacetylase [Deltaproteobacteria bacterium RIFOXYD12_FULL_50_9]|nr:MAG: polysaccharide deacetylase [Deltaproteobacteria bacterium RIFOXYD12_FULL_50_9]